MPFNLTDCQFAALMHDIGKFCQRTIENMDLTDDEKNVCPCYQGHFTHYHAGYTARFFKEILKMDNRIALISAIHHKDDEDENAKIIKTADRLASAVDRSDEMFSSSEKDREKFKKARLSTIFHEISFNDNKINAKVGKYSLCATDNLDYPNEDLVVNDTSQAINEYKQLFDRFIDEIKEYDWSVNENVSFSQLNRMYALLYKYTTTIPASTYESEITYVSLFDHMKLTAAIAGCLFLSESEEKFYMYEFDISGIQNFIYKIVEGTNQKKKIAKALRGRSAFIDILTESISYSILNCFGLHSTNIIFNTGGGATILLPYRKDTIDKVKNKESEISERLYEYFGTDITFVSAFVEMSGSELKGFKAEKALELKTKLDIAKTQKYNSLINNSSFFYKSANNKKLCEMCNNLIDADNDCPCCRMFEYISDFYTANDKFLIRYDFENKKNYENDINLGYCHISLVEDLNDLTENYYDSINCCELGEVKYSANSVPIADGQIVNFEKITNDLVPDSFGDKKLGILKMDIDNLSAIFAFGLKNKNSQSQQRALSKYLTLSRLLQLFFGKMLSDICIELSEEINENINLITDNATMFYINYSGGDDLVVIGPAYGIIRLAETIESDFNSFTLNEDNISFSAGIHIQNDKEPIRFGIQQAEKMLQLSKEQEGKKSISMINVPLRFKEYSYLLNDVDKLKEKIDSGEISRTFVYNLLLMIRDKNYNEFKYVIPIIHYYLFKNIDKQCLRNEFLVIFNDIRSQEKLNRCLLMLKLAIMFTRA